MKRFLLLLLFVNVGLLAIAQYPGNANDWVEYDKSYYRFSISEDGIYRLNKADLISAGIAESEIVGNNFKMIRNGEEVPLYVSTNNSFGNNDFIEFLGKANDGVADSPLYSSPLQQPGTSKSLFSNNSIHFLTIDTNGNHLRIKSVENNLTNLPAKEAFYMAEYIHELTSFTYGEHLKIGISGGSLSLTESHFGNTEGYNLSVGSGNNLSRYYTLNIDDYISDANIEANLEFKVASITNSPGDIQPGSVKATMGSSTSTYQIPGTFDYLKFDFVINSSNLGNRFVVTNNSPRSIYVPEFKLIYPRATKFSNKDFSYVNFNKSGSRYIELEDLPGNSSVILYDLSSLERITETIQQNTPIRTTSNSTSNNLVYDVSISTPSFINEISFENYLEGNDNLIVIYHEALEAPINGENYIDKFINHKSSDIGGGWNTKKVNINQIIDQFAYGIHGHSAAVKNYVQELKQLNKLPTHFILIGKGYEYTVTLNEEIEDDYIPPFGHPASDALLVTDYQQDNQLCSIGRISAINAEEVQMYVDKVIEYQNLMAQTSDSYQTKDKLWMKKSMHLGGGLTVFEQNYLKESLQGFEEVIESTHYGADVESFFKQSTDPIDATETASIDSLINEGVGIINYFGHSSSNYLEFSINDFSVYNNQGKYPFMLTNGCLVGDLFQKNRTLSEDFLFLDQKGTLTFMGPTQYGIASGMTKLADYFYDFFVNEDYGISIGEAVYKSKIAINNPSYFERLTKQQMVFHGDPTLSMYAHEKADYLISEEDLIFEPNNITAEDEQFIVKVVTTNIGKAFNEPVDVQISRTLPNGQVEVFTETFDNLYHQDTITFEFDTNILESAGVNQFNVIIDPENKLDEITRANNTLGAPITRGIIQNTVSPLFPSKFGITNKHNLELKAYASLFSSETRSFDIQIDTTELFNSSQLRSTSLVSNGGLIKWSPDIEYNDEQVYYWRVKSNIPDAMWSNSSFTFIEQYNEGWNQSHYFQFLYDDLSQVKFNDNRKIEFGNFDRVLNVRTGQELERNQVYYSIDGVLQDRKRCFDNGFAVAIIDENTGEPLENYRIEGEYGRFKSQYCNIFNTKAFYYRVDTPEYRKDFIDLLEDIEEGYYILIYTIGQLKPIEYNWAGDDAIYGETVFDKLAENGAQMTNAIPENGSYVFYFQKGNLEFEHSAEYKVETTADEINENVTLPSLYSKGNITSTLIGPAQSWEKFEWGWDNSYDGIVEGDNITYSIIGVREDDSESILFENEEELSLNLASINAIEYPYIKIRIQIIDDVYQTPPQLNYFRVIYEALPELALNITEITLNSPHEYAQNQNVTLSYSLENIYDKDMSPVLVEYTYSRAQGGQTILEQRYEELLAGQSQTIDFSLNTSPNELVGNNLLFIDANPNNDQPEQHHFNNIASIEFEIKGDNENPFLDVTFDGIQIINGDLVAKTPEIIISLTDENKFLALNDPDDFEIFIQHPDRDSLSIYNANSPEFNFFPANASDLENENKATIELRPEFTPGNYEMRVQATDRTNNKAGENDYLITFEVIDEDVITQVINYPNPFTTSTEFIAKIVGDAPDEVLIQIFTPNGKVIRELHSYGTDIELSQGNSYYRVAHWDGTDTFGDPVANGVYFYKITMKRGGELIEAYDESKYSEYFHDGIGKLYILR